MKTVTLSNAEWQALNKFLDNLTDYQCNEGCNDLPKDIQILFTPEEAQQLCKDYDAFNNSHENDKISWPISDFCLVGLLQHKIQNQL